MRGGGDEAPVERKAMDSKQPGAKFSSNVLSRAFDDDRSVGSAKSGKPLLAQLFFQNATVKVAVPIGEASLSGNYPLCDTNPGVSGSQNNIPTPTSCQNMRNVTSNPSTRPSTTNMLSLRLLNISSSSSKVVMQTRPLNSP